MADKVTGADIEELSLKELREIVRKLQELLSEEQKQKFQEIMRECRENDEKEDLQPVPARMSQELIEEKLEQIQIWQKQIDEGDLYLDTEEYEDYSNGYWDADWITEYYDNQGIGEKLMYMTGLRRIAWKTGGMRRQGF